MTNDIDEFRRNIRQRLKDVKGTIGTDITLHYTKHNENLEYYLQESNMHNILEPKLYDLILQTANHGFICGVNTGLQISNGKIEHINNEITNLRATIDSHNTSKNIDFDYLISSATNDINHFNLSIITFIICCVILFVCLFT